MNKVIKILAKAKELSEELSLIDFQEYKESYAEELIFNKEVEEIRLEMLCVQDRIEALVRYLEGEYSCVRCGKWFTPPSDICANDYFCPECEEKFQGKIERERINYDIAKDGLGYCEVRQAL